MSIKNLGLVLCLFAMLTFAIAGCNNSSSDNPGYWGGGGGTGTTYPTVTGIAPSTFIPGTQCTVTGSGFGANRDAGASYVAIVPQVTGGTSLNALGYVSWSDTSIVFIVPQNAVNGITYNVVVYRVTSSGTIDSTTTSSPSATQGTGSNPVGTAPAVTSQSPAQAAVGSAVTLTGTNFPTTNGWLSVAGTLVSATFTGTTAVFTVPTGTVTGAQVYIGGGTNGISAAYALQIGTTPGGLTVTSITPSPAAVNANITIAGTGFGATQGTSTVSMQTGTATPLTPVVVTWSATSVVVTVPAAAAAGSTYTVTLTVSGATASGTFRVLNPTTDPNITGVTPNTFAPTTAVALTVNGANFGATQGTSTVTIGATSATAVALTSIVWGATGITGTTPATLAAGTYYVYVTVNGVTATSTAITVASTPVTTGTWKTATVLSATLVPANVTVASLPSGKFMVIYQDTVTTFVMAQVFSGQPSAPSSAVDVSRAGTAYLAASKVAWAQDNAGNVVVMYQITGAGATANGIFVNIYTASTGTWGTTPQQLNTTVPGAVSSRLYAVSDGTAFYFAWEQVAAKNIISSRKLTNVTGTLFPVVAEQTQSTTLAAPADWAFGLAGTNGVLAVEERAAATPLLDACTFNTSTLAYGTYTATTLTPATGGAPVISSLKSVSSSTGFTVAYCFNAPAPIVNQIYSNTLPAGSTTWGTALPVDVASPQLIIQTVANVEQFNLTALSTGTPMIDFQNNAIASAIIYGTTASSSAWSTAQQISSTALGSGAVIALPVVIPGPGGIAQALLDQTFTTPRLVGVPYNGTTWTAPTSATVGTIIDGGAVTAPYTGAYASTGQAFAVFANGANTMYNSFY